ncbi:MAG: copper chaperone PCu(A)C [Magnetococcales bacterium]|nr:copper chaperone PCu(A)C [Magnetococcales bacterium]
MKQAIRTTILTGLALLSLLAGTWIAPAHSAGESPLQIETPWIRESPPGVPAMAAYMNLTNSGNTDLQIKEVSSPLFLKVELHETIQKDGVAMMQARKQFVIPAHKTMKLQPGGYHIMLLSPQKPLRAGDKVPLTLTLEGSAPVTLDVEVHPADHAKPHNMQHSGH